MTKAPRDHRQWSNKELEEDPQGYLAAQKAFKAERAAEAQKAFDDYELAAFTEVFVREGGARKDAEKAHRAKRNADAADAAEKANRQARERTRRHIAGRL